MSGRRFARGVHQPVALFDRVAMLEEELGRMNPDMSAIAAFQAKEAEYTQRVSDLEAATAERDKVM